MSYLSVSCEWNRSAGFWREKNLSFCFFFFVQFCQIKRKPCSTPLLRSRRWSRCHTRYGVIAPSPGGTPTTWGGSLRSWPAQTTLWFSSCDAATQMFVLCHLAEPLCPWRAELWSTPEPGEPCRVSEPGWSSPAAWHSPGVSLLCAWSSVLEIKWH